MKEEIEEILNANGTYALKKRYSKEILKIACLGSYALNKEKNINKGDFETISLEKIYYLLSQELLELQAEVFKNPQNYERMLEEMADVIACIVGMYAKIMTLIRAEENK